MLSMLGIVLGLGLLIGLAYRGVSVVLLAPVAAAPCGGPAVAPRRGGVRFVCRRRRSCGGKIPARWERQ